MDIKEIRKELRDWKTEVEDRLKRLEDAQKPDSEQQTSSEASAPATSKKSAADAPTGEPTA